MQKKNGNAFGLYVYKCNIFINIKEKITKKIYGKL